MTDVLSEEANARLGSLDAALSEADRSWRVPPSAHVIPRRTHPDEAVDFTVMLRPGRGGASFKAASGMDSMERGAL